MKPVAVLVHWSESWDFPEEDHVYAFAHFEQVAYKVAMETDSGYCKTKITVYYNDGQKVGPIRLDLSLTEERGFKDYLQFYYDRHPHSDAGLLYANTVWPEEENPVTWTGLARPAPTR